MAHALACLGWRERCNAAEFAGQRSHRRSSLKIRHFRRSPRLGGACACACLVGCEGALEEAVQNRHGSWAWTGADIRGFVPRPH